MTKLTDLIDAVGLDNIEVQELDSSATDFARCKGSACSKISFITDQDWHFRNKPAPMKKYGLILWMDREEVEAFKRSIS